MEPLDRLRTARVARLATTRADGLIDLVPFVFAFDPAGRLVSAVDHKPKRHQRLQRLDNIGANPAVTILADHYDEDWSQLWWVRARGDAVVIEPGEGGYDEAVDALVAKYRHYDDRRPTGPAVAVTLREVTGWSASTA